MNFGFPELVIVLVIVLLLFGATRLPKLARSLGQASHEFKKGISEGASGEETAPKGDPDEKVTMTRAELDAMLAEREAQARKDNPQT